MNTRPDHAGDAAIVIVDGDPASLGLSTEILRAAAFSNIHPCRRRAMLTATQCS